MKFPGLPSPGVLLAASACAVALLATPNLRADTLYNLSFSGSVNGTGTLDLNPTNHTVTVTLTNTTNLNGSTPSSDANLIAGLFFTLNNNPGSVTLASQAGSLVNISSTGPGGTAVPVSGSPTHWDAASYSGNNVCLETAGGSGLNCAVGGQPEDLIITNESSYNVNSSVLTHDPSILGTGTFVINVPGLNVDSLVTGANLVFGTTGTTETVNVTPGVPSVPEPSSLFLSGTGLLGAAVALRRRMLAGLRR